MHTSRTGINVQRAPTDDACIVLPFDTCNRRLTINGGELDFDAVGTEIRTNLIIERHFDLIPGAAVTVIP